MDFALYEIIRREIKKCTIIYLFHACSQSMIERQIILSIFEILADKREYNGIFQTFTDKYNKYCEISDVMNNS